MSLNVWTDEEGNCNGNSDWDISYPGTGPSTCDVENNNVHDDDDEGDDSLGNEPVYSLFPDDNAEWGTAAWVRMECVTAKNAKKVKVKKVVRA